MNRSTRPDASSKRPTQGCYLNQAGTSWPKPAAVRRAVQAAMEETHERWPESFETQHARVAHAFGADPERLLLTPGCTAALATAIADVDWSAGDRILISALEHHALHRPVSLLERRGMQVTTIGRAAHGPLDLEALRRELAQGGVRMVAMTAACNVTGELLPVREAAGLAHEFGALFLVDAAQIAGWIPIDVTELQVDLLAFAGHKALRAPWGIGGLYVAPHTKLASPAASCTLPAPGAEPAICSPMPGYCDVGSVDRLALAGLAATLEGAPNGCPPDGLNAARALMEPLEACLDEHPRARRLGVRDPERRLPTVGFTIDGQALGETLTAFTTAGITVAGGLQCAPLAHRALGTDPSGAIRISVGPANNADDLQRAIEVIEGL